MCPPAKVNGVWPFNDPRLRTSFVVGQTPGATQRCLNPGCSERIGNSRRTGGRGRLQTSTAVCRIPCLILCLAYGPAMTPHEVGGLRCRCRPPAPPVALCVAWGDGVAGAAGGGGIVRRGPAGGLMAGGAGARRPTRIAGSSAANGPLIARYAAPTRRPGEWEVPVALQRVGARFLRRPPVGDRRSVRPLDGQRCTISP